MIRAVGHCVNCGHPVAADGVTLVGAAAEPREGPRAARYDDTACVCTAAPSRVEHWVEALRAAGLELRRTDGSEPERADYVRAFGVSTGVLCDDAAR